MIPNLKLKIKKMRNHYVRYTEYKHNNILDGVEGNDLIYKVIESGKPAMITRIGSTELSVLTAYEKTNTLPEKIQNNICELSGFFPRDEKLMKEFRTKFNESLANSDVIGIWYNPGEGNIINKYARSANLVELRALEPYYYNSPWSRALAGKRVLVIHPFESSIKHQFMSNKKIFQNPEVLPSFDLLTMKSVQTLAGNETEYKDWFDALDAMCNNIDEYDYDICIIGAGAYGLPLAAHVKKRGKIAIHMGGSTQVLFGIKGKRWDDHPFISRLYNENWIRPIPEEKIEGSNKVEGGCYW